MSFASVKMSVRKKGTGHGISPGAVARAMAKARAWTEARWTNLAVQKLNLSKVEYLNAMAVYTRGTKLYLRLRGTRRGWRDFQLAVAREIGQPAFDLRRGFLTSAKKVSRHRSGTLPRSFRNIPMDPRVARQPFARISAAKQSGWKHPGVKAAHLMDEVVEAVLRDLVPELVDDLMQGLEL